MSLYDEAEQTATHLLKQIRSITEIPIVRNKDEADYIRALADALSSVALLLPLPVTKHDTADPQ